MKKSALLDQVKFYILSSDKPKDNSAFDEDEPIMIGERIKAFRKLHNLSQVEFSTALGISQGMFRRPKV